MSEESSTILSNAAPEQQSTTPKDATGALTPTPEAQPRTPENAPLVGENMEFAPGWYDKLGDDMAQHANTLKKFNSLPGMAKSIVHLEKMKGVPAPDADAETIEAFRRMAGLPETADGMIQKPEELPPGVEWSEEAANTLAKLVHKHHASPALANEIASMHLQMTSDQITAANEAKEAERAQIEADLKQEWGNNFDEQIGNAQKVAGILGLDMDDSSIGDNIPLIRALAKMSDKLSEGTIKGASGGQQTGLEDVRGARSKARDIALNPSNPDYAAFHDPAHPNHNDVNKRYDLLNRQAST